MPGYWCLRVETIPSVNQGMGQVQLDTVESEGGRIGPREPDTEEKRSQAQKMTDWTAIPRSTWDSDF